MRGSEARYQTSPAPRGSQGKTLKSILKLIYEVIVRLPTFGESHFCHCNTLQFSCQR